MSKGGRSWWMKRLIASKERMMKIKDFRLLSRTASPIPECRCLSSWTAVTVLVVRLVMAFERDDAPVTMLLLTKERPVAILDRTREVL
jgi:hypothetical protein